MEVWVGREPSMISARKEPRLYRHRRKRRGSAVTVLFIFYFLLPCILPSVVAKADDEGRKVNNDQKLGSGEFHSHLLHSEKNDTVQFILDVYVGGNVDIYIMTSYQFRNRYEEDKEFNTSFEREHVSYLNGTWIELGHDSYYMIIDNKDNAHPDDAVSNDDVVYHLEYDSYWTDDAGKAAWFVIVFCGIIPATAAIAIGWIVNIGNRKRQKGLGLKL